MKRSMGQTGAWLEQVCVKNDLVSFTLNHFPQDVLENSTSCRALWELLTVIETSIVHMQCNKQMLPVPCIYNIIGALSYDSRLEFPQ